MDIENFIFSNNGAATHNCQNKNHSVSHLINMLFLFPSPTSVHPLLLTRHKILKPNWNANEFAWLAQLVSSKTFRSASIAWIIRFMSLTCKSPSSLKVLHCTAYTSHLRTPFTTRYHYKPISVKYEIDTCDSQNQGPLKGTYFKNKNAVRSFVISDFKITVFLYQIIKKYVLKPETV